MACGTFHPPARVAGGDGQLPPVLETPRVMAADADDAPPRTHILFSRPMRDEDLLLATPFDEDLLLAELPAAGRARRPPAALPRTTLRRPEGLPASGLPPVTADGASATPRSWDAPPPSAAPEAHGARRAWAAGAPRTASGPEGAHGDGPPARPAPGGPPSAARSGELARSVSEQLSSGVVPLSLSPWAPSGSPQGRISLLPPRGGVHRVASHLPPRSAARAICARACAASYRGARRAGQRRSLRPAAGHFAGRLRRRPEDECRSSGAV
ncbi:unnamed protein product [Prorocentrum cordatum]|uniref:Anaphase-promoting complex subunit 1 n=1 Tax=Prorocentrum cordatum TaxID=2364126 RepID=A0ABN9UW27_9DINO|nr:unnamed protein product [Polarella glacialis]